MYDSRSVDVQDTDTLTVHSLAPGGTCTNQLQEVIWFFRPDDKVSNHRNLLPWDELNICLFEGLMFQGSGLMSENASIPDSASVNVTPLQAPSLGFLPACHCICTILCLCFRETNS